MSKRSLASASRTAALALAVLFVGGGRLRADLYQLSYTSGPGVSISYTGASNQGTMAIPFSVTDKTTGSSFQAFCVDVYHDQYSPASYTAPAYTIASNPGFVQSVYPTTAYTTDLASRLNYVGYLYNSLISQVGSDANVAGAVQLALWELVDKSVSFSTSATGLTTDTDNLLTLLGTPGQSGSVPSNLQFIKSNGSSVTVNLDAYSTSANYSGEDGQLIVLHNPVNSGLGQVNQDLITWDAHINTVPEPSTLAFAGLGTLAFVGYALRRRARA